MAKSFWKKSGHSYSLLRHLTQKSQHSLLESESVCQFLSAEKFSFKSLTFFKTKFLETLSISRIYSKCFEIGVANSTILVIKIGQLRCQFCVGSTFICSGQASEDSAHHNMSKSGIIFLWKFFIGTLLFMSDISDPLWKFYY